MLRDMRNWPWTDRARTIQGAVLLLGVLLAIGIAGGIQ